MIRLVTVPLLVLFTTSTVWAETPLATASKIEAARHASTPPSPQPEAAGASHQSVPIAPSKAPSRRHLRCCNVIGALVGGAIGVGLGTFLTRNACDVEDCTSAYVKVSVIFGGLGATIGALGQLSGLPLLFVRKAAKDYGTCRLAEGTEVAGRRVLIVEDVITAGGQVIESAESLRGLGAIIDHALCVVDRQAGGRHALAERGIELAALFTLDELKAADGGRQLTQSSVAR